MIDDYTCKDFGLHDYSETVGDDENLLVEICVRCGHTIRFPKCELGRIDNKRYGETHELWFLQPCHKLYEKYYGKAKPELPSKSQQRKDAIELAKEEYRRAAFKN